MTPEDDEILPAATQCCPHKNDLFNSKADINITKLKQLKAMSHEAIFLATCNAARKIASCDMALKGFRIAHLNITSLLKHLDQLRIYLHDKPLRAAVLQFIIGTT